MDFTPTCADSGAQVLPPGLSAGLIVCGLLATVFGTLTAALILLIAFIWLAERYQPLIAAAVIPSARSGTSLCRMASLPAPLERFSPSRTGV